MGKNNNKKLSKITKKKEDQKYNKKKGKKGNKSLKRNIGKKTKNEIKNDEMNNTNKNKVTNIETEKYNNNSLNSLLSIKIFGNNIDNETFSSIDQYTANTTFKFLILKKKDWMNYLDLQDEKRWCIVNELVNQFLKSKKTEIDILIELIVLIDMERRLSKFSNKELDEQFFEEPVAEIWNLNDFNGFISEGWQKYNIGFQYKKRYTEKFKKSININWENILYFIGFSFKLKNENIWDYLWFLFYLPKRLLILWLARLNVIENDDHWWIFLLKEWKSFFFEVLRCKGIKNWLSIFIPQNDYKNDNIHKVIPLKINDNFAE